MDRKAGHSTVSEDPIAPSSITSPLLGRTVPAISGRMPASASSRRSLLRPTAPAVSAGMAAHASPSSAIPPKKLPSVHTRPTAPVASPAMPAPAASAPAASAPIASPVIPAASAPVESLDIAHELESPRSLTSTSSSGSSLSSEMYPEPEEKPIARPAPEEKPIARPAPAVKKHCSIPERYKIKWTKKKIATAVILAVGSLIAGLMAKGVIPISGSGSGYTGCNGPEVSGIPNKLYFTDSIHPLVNASIIKPDNCDSMQVKLVAGVNNEVLPLGTACSFNSLYGSLPITLEASPEFIYNPAIGTIGSFKDSVNINCTGGAEKYAALFLQTSITTPAGAPYNKATFLYLNYAEPKSSSEHTALRGAFAHAALTTEDIVIETIKPSK